MRILKLLLLITTMSFLYSCNVVYEDKAVLSKYANDTLYIRNLKPKEFVISTMDSIDYDKFYKPSRDQIVEKAMISKPLADEWLRNNKSHEKSFVTKSHLTLFAWIMIIIIAIIFLCLFWFFVTALKAIGKIYNP